MRKLVLLCLVCFATSCYVRAQGESIRVAFWNVENFFDPFVDSTSSYNAFTEKGVQNWTKSRFYRKRNNVYKTILALSENKPIGIMGLCEVENDYVLNSVFSQTPLKQHNYRWVHYDGPDRRCIDPAIVYSLDYFMLVDSRTFPYYNPEDTSYHSRDILYAKFIDKQDDTLHVFVNHWPSRYSGELETLGSRACAAAILRSKVDSICSVMPEGYAAKIVIMGDLNDCPEDPSISDVLKARSLCEQDEGCLVNLFGKKVDLGFEGTAKHQAVWQIFDQIIVNDEVIDSKEGLHFLDGSAKIFHPDFLLEDDGTHGGKKPYRTYSGPKYIGGFSDHLPVFVDLVY